MKHQESPEGGALQASHIENVRLEQVTGDFENITALVWSVLAY